MLQCLARAAIGIGFLILAVLITIFSAIAMTSSR